VRHVVELQNGFTSFLWKEMLMKASSLAIALALLGVGSLAPLCAEEAFMVPRSNRVIKGELILPDGSPVKFGVRDGSWVTVEDRKENYFFGFSGVVADPVNPSFLIYQLTRMAGGQTDVRYATEHPLVIPFGKGVVYSPVRNPAGGVVGIKPITEPIPISLVKKAKFGAGTFRLLVNGFEEWQFATAPIDDPSQYSVEELKVLFGDPQTADGLCCVTCELRTVCANSVQTPCGSCGGSGGGGMPN
jgi:hypothetical protein